MDERTGTAAMAYLGCLLNMLAELHPDDGCRAYDDALEFYNEQNPDDQVMAIPGYVTRLVHFGPLDNIAA
jgi:hypothetical protein